MLLRNSAFQQSNGKLTGSSVSYNWVLGDGNEHLQGHLQDTLFQKMKMIPQIPFNCDALFKAAFPQVHKIQGCIGLNVKLCAEHIFSGKPWDIYLKVLKAVLISTFGGVTATLEFKGLRGNINQKFAKMPSGGKKYLW